ncbi:MAG: glycosyl transferase [Candidatus Hydrogenedentota bacterium]
MKIGFDISPLTRRRSGVGNYCHHLLKALLGLDETLEVKGLAVCTRPLDLAVFRSNLKSTHLPVPTRAMYWMWSALGRPNADSLLGGVDVYHATNYFLPPTRRAKRVLTIHDVSFRKCPEYCSPKIVGVFSSRVAGFARESDAVLADSESTRKDIIELLEVPGERVHAVHLAADERFRPVRLSEARREVREAFGIDGPYVLFVGTVEIRKNIAGLVEAFDRIKREVPHRLVVAGALGWNIERDLMGRLLASRATIVEPAAGQSLGPDRLVYLEYVSDDHLPALYGAADAFVFPSFYEGFGLPVLEAMACGCPVITSTNSSLPEVGGDAAEYCEANDVESIANVMRHVLDNRALRDQMSQRGLARAAAFSWRATAEQTLAVYRSVWG